MGSTNSIIKLDNNTIDLNSYECSNRGLILPLVSEYTWPIWIRVILYVFGLIYFFVGIAIICDIFMNSIEKITSKTRTIKYPDPKDRNKYIDKEVKVWNDTVANLTLMALGSSSPEILLSIIEIVGNNFQAGELGPGTIVGSAAFNLLVITSICVSAIESPGVRRIKYFKVFLCTSAWSFFAYFWMYFTLEITSPNVVELWEAIVTFLCFPGLIYSSYYIEKNFSYSKSDDCDDEEANNDEEKSSLLNIGKSNLN
jgi:solute carrier family 8 (sodium/calcium exchanger)